MIDEHDQPGTTLDAGLRLQVAVDQLVQPGIERLDRSRPETDPAVRAVDEEHAKRATQLRDQHADARENRDAAGMRRALQRLIAHERQAQARAVTTAPLPSLLEQLRDAVTSSAGGGTSRTGSVHRSPIGLGAAELLGQIERHVVADRHSDATLAQWVTTWAVRQDADTGPAANLAEAWVADARDLLTPSSSFALDAPCPICGTRWVWADDGEGSRVKRPALTVTYASKIARCAAPTCTGRWTEHYLGQLGALLGQDQEDRAS